MNLIFVARRADVMLVGNDVASIGLRLLLAKPNCGLQQLAISVCSI